MTIQALKFFRDELRRSVTVVGSIAVRATVRFLVVVEKRTPIVQRRRLVKLDVDVIGRSRGLAIPQPTHGGAGPPVSLAAPTRTPPWMILPLMFVHVHYKKKDRCIT